MRCLLGAGDQLFLWELHDLEFLGRAAAADEGGPRTDHQSGALPLVRLSKPA